MKAPYLLDTNVASYVIKGNIPSVDRWLGKVPVESVFISTVTEAELRYGVARRPDATRLETLVKDFLRTIAILPWDSEAAKQYGWLRSGDEGSGVHQDQEPEGRRLDEGLKRYKSEWSRLSSRTSHVAALTFSSATRWITCLKITCLKETIPPWNML